MKDARRRTADAPLLPVNPPPTLPVPPTRPNLDADAERAASEARPADPAPVTMTHIPRFLVLPEVVATAGAGHAPLVGAHRFPAAPTPVLRASMELMGFASVAAATRPFRSRGARYRFTRFSPASPTGQGDLELRSGRLPKV